MKNRASPLAPTAGRSSPVMMAMLRGGRLLCRLRSLFSRPRSAPSPKARARVWAVAFICRLSCWLSVGWKSSTHSGRSFARKALVVM